MKRFVFPLERVRRWRQTEVDLAQAKLQSLFAELDKLKQAGSNLRKQLDAAGEAAQSGAAAGATYDAGCFAGLEAFRQFVKRRELEIAMEESQCQRRIEDQRSKLTAARRNCQVMERLKENRLDEWNRAYAKELEETASDLHLANLRRSPALSLPQSGCRYRSRGARREET